MKNGHKITPSTAAAGYLCAAVIAATLWYAANCWSPFVTPRPVFGWFLALLGVWFGVAARGWGLTALTVALPVATGITAQLGSFGFSHFVTLNNPGLDLAQGFLVGAACRHWRELNPLNAPRRYTVVVAALLHLYLVTSTVVTIANNLVQSTSPFVAKGLFLNAMQLRRLAFADDYFPLDALYVQTLALGLIFVGWRLWRDDAQATTRRLLTGLSLGGLLLGVYAIIQYYSTIGHFRDHADRGLNSLFPDLHSYASYALVAGTAAIIVTGAALTERQWRRVMFGGVALLATCAGLYLSGSRFTLLASPFVLGSATYFTLVQPHGRRVRLIVGVAATALLMVTVLTITAGGYRRTDFGKLGTLLTSGEFSRINTALSNRPEIWATALHMTAQRPLTGVGNGAFYRLSSVPGYSSSNFLKKRGGENAHNFPLQLLAELGVPGLLLILGIVVLPGTSVATRLLIVAVLAGNVFAHSLLVHEMMMLMALILAVHHANADQNIVAATERLARALQGRSRQRGLVALAGVGASVWLLAACRRDELPFRHGDLCAQQRERDPDGWIGGRYHPRATRGMRRLDIRLRAGHPDIEKVAVGVQVRVEDADTHDVVLNEVWQFTNHEAQVFPVRTGKLRRLRLFIDSDRCFVPKSLGLSNDNRRLALNIALIKL